MYIILSGNYSQVIRCTAAACMNWLQFLVAVTADGSLLVYYLVVCFLHLLLSGDVELNPGPTIEDRPEVPLLLQWLDPLVNWQSFGCQLPGITRDIITMIEQSGVDTKQQKETLFTIWLSNNHGATWSDVIAALKRRKETELVKSVTKKLKSMSCLHVSSFIMFIINVGVAGDNNVDEKEEEEGREKVVKKAERAVSIF